MNALSLTKQGVQLQHMMNCKNCDLSTYKRMSEKSLVRMIFLNTEEPFQRINVVPIYFVYHEQSLSVEGLFFK